MEGWIAELARDTLDELGLEYSPDRMIVLFRFVRDVLKRMFGPKVPKG